MNADNKNKCVSIHNLLNNKHCSFATLYKKMTFIQDIDRQLKQQLDPSLQNKFELANLNADSAILLTNSSAWATRLRYNIPNILGILNNQLNDISIKTIRIKLNKATPIKPVENSKPRYLSDNTARFLNNAANNFSDPELRECFLKLSKNSLEKH